MGPTLMKIQQNLSWYVLSNSEVDHCYNSIVITVAWCAGHKIIYFSISETNSYRSLYPLSLLSPSQKNCWSGERYERTGFLHLCREHTGFSVGPAVQVFNSLMVTFGSSESILLISLFGSLFARNTLLRCSSSPLRLFLSQWETRESVCSTGVFVWFARPWTHFADPWYIIIVVHVVNVLNTSTFVPQHPYLLVECYALMASGRGKAGYVCA